MFSNTNENGFFQVPNDLQSQIDKLNVDSNEKLEIKFEIENLNIKDEFKKLSNDFRKDTPAAIKELFKWCVQFNMSERPFFSEVKYFFIAQKVIV